MSSSIRERNYSAELRRLPSGVLHLGTKTKILRKAGFKTIGQIVDAWPIAKRRVRGLGTASIETLGERLIAIADSESLTGLFDWERYSELSNVPLIPSNVRPRTGSEFLHTLPNALEEIADGLADPIYSVILKNRLAKPPSEQMTLDEIGREKGVFVTRERVRQKEKKLLKELAGALIWEDFDGLGALFRPSFTIWWKLAARHFRHQEDISFDELVIGLCEVWRVSPEVLMEHIPFVVAVITGDNKMPGGFKSSTKIDSRFYGDLALGTRELELSWLRLGKYAFDLQRKGITTVGDLVEVCRAGRSSVLASKACQVAINELEVVAQSLEGSGDIVWSDYRVKSGLETLPSNSPSNPADFVRDLVRTVTSLLEVARVTGRAKKIYDLRTGRIRTERLTLAQVAERLEAHGPSIKREESVFLQFLNDLILQREYCRSPVWLEESWIHYWRDAAEEFEKSAGDFDAFRRQLASRWSVTVNQVIPASPTLWAVIGGYPNGRPIKSKSATLVIEVDKARASGKIKLRGFRQIH